MKYDIKSTFGKVFKRLKTGKQPEQAKANVKKLVNNQEEICEVSQASEKSQRNSESAISVDRRLITSIGGSPVPKQTDLSQI